MTAAAWVRCRAARVWVLIVAIAAAACARVDRPATPAAMTVANGCGADSGSLAGTTRDSLGTAAIRCEPWDIGTGVTGYAWRAQSPRAVVLIQHGYGHYAHQYVAGNAQLIPHLVDMGVSVYAFDMWGNGRSPGKRGATDLDQALRDHLAARRKLAGQAETTALPVFLLGHSVGGLLTVTSALRDQPGLRGVILLAPTVADANAFARGLVRLGAFLMPAATIPGPPNKIESLTALTEVRAQLGQDSLYFRRVSWITAATGAAMAHANWERYPELRIPVLALHGAADTVSDPAASRRLIEAIASQDKTLHTVPGGLHALLEDTKRAEARQLILDWIEARLPTHLGR